MIHSAISSGSSSHQPLPVQQLHPLFQRDADAADGQLDLLGQGEGGGAKLLQQLLGGLLGEHQVAVDRKVPAFLQRLPDALDAVGGKDFFGRFGNLLMGEHQLLREGEDGDAPLHRVKAQQEKEGGMIPLLTQQQGHAVVLAGQVERAALLLQRHLLLLAAPPSKRR